MKKRRNKPIKIQPEYHLIVTEGEATEPQYFRAIRDTINQTYRGRIQLDIYGEGQNTLSLFDKAKKHVQQSSNVYKHVWIVYDTDKSKDSRKSKARTWNSRISKEGSVILELRKNN